MWNPFKKESETKEERRYIPKDKIEHFSMLHDDYVRAGKADKLPRYKFWEYLSEIFPEIKDGGIWTVNFDNAIQPYVYKRTE